LQDSACFRVKSSGWSVIGPGLKHSYSEGRRCCARARRDPVPENFHQWRKRIKDLLSQVRMLRPIWPEQLAPIEAELDHLSDSLGEDHDLFLLIEPTALKRFEEKEVSTLKALVAGRQKHLRAEALALGSMFYEAKPAAFCQRFRTYWKRWRQEPKNQKRAA
jgi:CHAD domain-containing protein